MFNLLQTQVVRMFWTKQGTNNMKTKMLSRQQNSGKSSRAKSHVRRSYICTRAHTSTKHPGLCRHIRSQMMRTETALETSFPCCHWRSWLSVETSLKENKYFSILFSSLYTSSVLSSSFLVLSSFSFTSTFLIFLFSLVPSVFYFSLTRLIFLSFPVRSAFRPFFVLFSLFSSSNFF